MIIWTVRSKIHSTTLQQYCQPYCCTVVPTKPSTLSSQLCFHSMLTHPQAQRHKWSLCFAFSHHRLETGMFERQAAVVGRGPLTAASCPSGAGSQPGASYRCQMGHWSSEGWLAGYEKQSRKTIDPQPCKIAIY